MWKYDNVEMRKGGNVKMAYKNADLFPGLLFNFGKSIHHSLLPIHHMRKIILSIALLIVSYWLPAQTYAPTWQSLDQRPVPQWYKDAKFGIFIHWGVYSVPGWSTTGDYAEWYQNGLNTG